MRRLQMHLPDWMQDWLEILIPGIQIFLIILVAWLINWLIKRIISRAGKAYDLPHELLMPLRGVFRWIIIAAAVLAPLRIAVFHILPNAAGILLSGDACGPAPAVSCR